MCFEGTHDEYARSVSMRGGNVLHDERVRFDVKKGESRTTRTVLGSVCGVSLSIRSVSAAPLLCASYLTQSWP